MILGIGCDIVDVDRIKKAHKKMGWTFVHRILGPNELEVFSGLEGGQEVIYLARRVEAVYVLHAFQKKTQATPKGDIELARRRLAAVMEANR